MSVFRPDPPSLSVSHLHECQAPVHNWPHWTKTNKLLRSLRGWGGANSKHLRQKHGIFWLWHPDSEWDTKHEVLTKTSVRRSQWGDMEGMHGEECSTRKHVQHTGRYLSSSSTRLSSYCIERQWKDDLPLLTIQYSGDIYSAQMNSNTNILVISFPSIYSSLKTIWRHSSSFNVWQCF